MTSRERNLTVVFLGALLLLGGGGMFHLFFWKPYSNLSGRLEAAEKDIMAKQKEQLEEKIKIHRAQAIDPRLAHWEYFSLPESPSKDAEALQRHISQERVDYEQQLSLLLKEAGFQGVSTAAKPVDSRNVPQFTNKTPIYTRLAYTIEAKASYKSVVKMFEAFHKDGKLDQVRDFKLRKPQTPGTRGQRGPGARGPGGIPGAPGMVPGAADGAPMPEVQASRADALLDVTMTVEALIVSGAKTRKDRGTEDEKVGTDKSGKRTNTRARGAALKEKDLVDGEEQEQPAANASDPALPAISILAPQRHYLDDMLYKNIYSGLSKTRGTKDNGDLSEDPNVVLGAVKLVLIEKVPNSEGGWLDSPYLWNVEFYDQGSGKKHHCTLDKTGENTFSIRDRYETPVVKGTLVDVNIRGIVFKAEDKYYRLRMGDFLETVIHPDHDEDGVILDPLCEPLDKYTRGEWKGPSTSGKSTQSEERAVLLKSVKLAKSTNNGRRWDVEFFDSALKRDYSCTPDSSVRNVFEIKDRPGAVIFKGTVVDANTHGVVIQLGTVFYKMKLGDSFDDVLNPPLDASKRPVDPDRAPIKDYQRGDWKAPETPPAGAVDEKKEKTEEKKEDKKDEGK